MKNEIVDERLGAAIRRRRNQEGLNQTQLARMSGVAQSTISAYENGKHAVSVSDLIVIARALRVPMGEFLPSEDMPTDWRSALRMLDDLDPDSRAALVESLVAVMRVMRNRIAPAGQFRLETRAG